MDEPIYHYPAEYDLEHAHPEADLKYYQAIVRRWRPRQVLELGCGTGRVTIPLAQLSTAGMERIVGLERVPEMLRAARAKAARQNKSVRQRLQWLLGDLRTYRAAGQFDLIIAPCGTLCHLLSLRDQSAAWQAAFANLAPGGRFVADVPLPEFSVLAESTQIPRRTILQLDNDTAQSGPGGGKRLLRYKTVSYYAAEQRARVRYLYDEFGPGRRSRRFFSDYQHHVFFPRELELLFRAAGFAIESLAGDYSEAPLANHSRVLLMVGRKPRTGKKSGPGTGRRPRFQPQNH